MGDERVDAGHGQERAEPERHGGGIPHLDAGGVDRLGEILPAPLRGRREGVPTRLRPGAIGLLPARRHGDGAVLEGGAVVIAHGIERRDNAGSELAGLGDHRRDGVLGEIGEELFSKERVEAGAVLERKGNVGNGGLVGHGCALSVLFLRKGCTRGSPCVNNSE